MKPYFSSIMKHLLLSATASIFLTTSIPAIAENKPPYTSNEMRADRRELMYYQYCLELVKRVMAKKNSNADFRVINESISGLMQGYAEILAQEYTPGDHSKEFITGIMRQDKDFTKQRIDKEPYQCVVDVRDSFANKYEQLVNKYRPYMKN